MGDWGLYSALRGTNNWEQRRQDKMLNLQMVQQNAKEAEAEAVQSMKAETEINKYFEEMQNMDVLPEDQERVQQVERDSRANVIKGIAQYNGDLKRYMSSGGITDLGAYKNAVMKSGEVKQALSNKANLHSYLTDAAKGNRFFNKVNVEVPVLGPDGKPTDETKIRKMNFDDQMALFRAGKIAKINYNGSENKVKLNPFSFMQRPKDPSKPFSKDNVVTTSNIVFQAMEAGASEEQANALADSYAARVRAGGETWKWGNKSEEERLLMQNKLDLAKTKGKGTKTSGGTMVLNQLVPQLTRLGEGKEMPMGNKDHDFWKKMFRMNYDEKTGLEKSSLALGGIDAQTGKEYDLSKALSYSVGDRYVSRKDKNGKLSRYLVANAIFDADTSDENTPIDEGFLGSNKTSRDAGDHWQYGNAEDFGIRSEDLQGRDVYRGEVLIPIERQIQDPLIRDEVNKYRGITNRQDATAASATEQDYHINLYMQAKRVADATGVSIQEAMIGLSE
jgi:hypothetical protein